jgi:membrane fusion protein (multidrug efflux system)
MKYLYTITQMKPILFLSVLALTLSCNSNVKESQSLTDLKSKKEVLIKEMNRIGTELKAIETAISALDTLKKVMTVTAIKADVKAFNHYIEVQGTVKADKTIELHAEMGGTVSAILVKEGQKVTKPPPLSVKQDFGSKILEVKSNTCKLKHKKKGLKTA